MQLNAFRKLFLSVLIVAGLTVIPAAAAYEETVHWGDPTYQILVPGFIEGRKIEINGQTTDAIVIEKPAKNSYGKYTFFEIITTDKKATMVTSTVSTYEEAIGDFMADLENGTVSYSPTLMENLDDVADQPIYMGFSFRDDAFDVIYECPLWVVFEGSETTAPAPVALKEVAASPNASKVLVNGQQTSFEAYTIGGYNYFKLRDLAMAVQGSGKQFEVTWDGEKKAINLVSGSAYTAVGGELAAGSGTASVQAIPNQSKIYLDGQEIALDAYTINGNNYFKLRDVATVFDFGVTWDGTLNQIVIDTTTGYTE
ncbi:hypothetical protein SDC9_112081 [bioreactor metagenome]|uniref:Copper amine oxidase-like N-terminal domain-containing protein n=1 Tax=bioreactor metagenome TaxID=1076179 RepID=A0A645BI92_9ZZZZ